MKIMTWNIQEFDYDKILDIDNRYLQRLSELRLRHIIDNIIPEGIHELDIPAIVVIQEIKFQRAVVPGELGNDNKACNMFNHFLGALNSFHKRRINKEGRWKMVPPLNLDSPSQNLFSDIRGTSLRIAVLFRSDVLEFHGPNILCMTNYGYVSTNLTSASMNNAVVYPDILKNLLPSEEVILWVDGKPKDYPQNVLAGQFLYINGLKNVRYPWITQFREKVFQEPFPRLITVISCHAPSVFTKNVKAEDFVSSLFSHKGLGKSGLGLIKDDEVRVVLGDFNLESDAVFNNYPISFEKYTKLLGYKMHFIDNKTAASKTTLLSKIPNEKIDINSNDVHYKGRFALDNILTRYGRDLNPPLSFKPQIIDRIIGTPPTDVARGPGYGIDMYDTIYNLFQKLQKIKNSNPDLSNEDLKQTISCDFMQPLNYLHICGAQYGRDMQGNITDTILQGVSDHLALILDIL